jgi:hypothetical protein
MPALVVAIARAPAFTNNLAVTASQALGRIKIGGPWCMLRKASALALRAIVIYFLGVLHDLNKPAIKKPFLLYTV